jgi:hypothetical protein
VEGMYQLGGGHDSAGAISTVVLKLALGVKLGSRSNSAGHCELRGLRKASGRPSTNLPGCTTRACGKLAWRRGRPGRNPSDWTDGTFSSWLAGQSNRRGVFRGRVGSGRSILCRGTLFTIGPYMCWDTLRSILLVPDGRRTAVGGARDSEVSDSGSA